MSTPQAGGPAFPVEIGHGGYRTESLPGMSLRDYFAAKALPALLAPVFAALTDLGIQDAAKLEVAGRLVAAAAYATADAMLKTKNNP